MKNFFNHIRARRIALEGAGGDSDVGAEPRGGLLELIDVWLRTLALTDRQVKVGDVTMYWEPLTEVPYDIRLKATQWAHGIGLIGGRAALQHIEMLDYAYTPDQVDGENAIDPYEAALQNDLDMDGVATRRMQPDEGGEQEFRRRERLSA
jgi:hypothetical protein